MVRMKGKSIFKARNVGFKIFTTLKKLDLSSSIRNLHLFLFFPLAENLFLGNERAKNGVIDWNESISRTKELLDRVGLHESPNTLITNMGVGKQQLVEIAKALAKEVKLLILDEPTASLNENDSEKLLELLLQFKAHGISSILISHKLSEVNKVADSITILRDGATIETLDAGRTRLPKTGSFAAWSDAISHIASRRVNSKIGEVIFEVRDWNVYHPLHEDRKVSNNVNINVRKGEVVGTCRVNGSWKN